jgi:hypothetical protein
VADQEDIGTLLSKIAVDVADLKKGLQVGRNELQSFKSFSADLSAQVKKALTFTVGILGIGALLGELKSLLQGVTEVGARLETTKLAAYAVGQNFGYTSANIDKLVTDLKQLKVSSVDGYEAVSNFISHGLDPRQLISIAQAARDLAVAAGKSPQEMFSLLIDSIVTGTPRALRQAKIPIKEFQDSVLAEGKSLDENLKLSSQERSQVMIDLILKYAQTVEGVSQSTAGSYSRQLGQIKFMATQAKEVLWDFLQPLLAAITGEKIKVWGDLLNWLTLNRAELQKWGQTIGEFVKLVWGVIAAVISWTVANGNLVKTFIELVVAYKLAGYLVALGAAIPGVVSGLYSLATGVTAVKVAFGGWLAILIQVAVALAALGAYKFMKNPVTTLPDGQRYIEWGGHGITELPSVSSGETTPGSENTGHEEVTSPQEMADDMAQRVNSAMQKYQDLMGEKAGIGKGGKGGKAGPEEDLFGEYLKMLDQERQAKIRGAQDSLEILKAGNEKEKAELEKKLAEGLIDGQTYYAKLQEMQQAETAASLKLIEEKKAAQAAAYKDALADLERQDLSPEMKGYRRQEEEIKNRMALAQLNAEAARVKLEGEVKVTQELKRQVEVQKQYKEKAEDMRVEMAGLWGPIAEQEAKIQKLYLDWQRAKAEAVKAGAYTPEYAQTLDQYYQSKINFARSGDQYNNMASSITQGFSSLVDAITSGGQDLLKSLNSFFKSLFTSALKPGLDQLQQLLINGFKQLFGEAGSALASAVMGAIGLIGMLLTSGGSSSWSSSGVTSSVTSHEAVRGIIAGETSIPIAQIGESLQDALVPTNSILNQIEANTRGGRGGLGGGRLDITVTLKGIEEQINAAIERYFREYLVLGARG